MKKFTYANEYTVLGNIIDENEVTYTVEFEAAPGFMDTVTFEKELTVVEEIEVVMTEEKAAEFVQQMKKEVYGGTWRTYNMGTKAKTFKKCLVEGLVKPEYKEFKKYTHKQLHKMLGE